MAKDKTYFDREKLVDEVLTSEPDFFLSDNFAEKVAKKAERKFAWDLYIREFLVYLGALAGIAAVAAVMAFIWYGDNWKQWYDLLVSNVYWVVGVNVMVVFVLFTDRVLLRYFLYKSLRDKSYVL